MNKNQTPAFGKYRIVLFFLIAPAVLFLWPFRAGENGAAPVMMPPASVAASQADPLAQAGIKACVPRPSVEPPPVGGDSVPHRVMAATMPGPCPEGFVPQPTERWGPRRGPGGETLSALPFAAAMAPSAPATSADFYYASAYQFVAAPGTYAFLTQHVPAVAPEDFHSLAEMAVQSTDRRQGVEVGWTVDRAVNLDENPHLFVFHWVDGVPACYNGCGWVQYSSTLFPGMPVASDGTARQYMILFWQGDWWVGYQGEWIGYFPGSLWSGVYTASGLIQWFGEVAVSVGATAPATDMGSSALGTAGSTAARIYQISLYNDDGSVRGPAAPSFYSTNAIWYNTAADSQLPNGFSYGGGGAL